MAGDTNTNRLTGVAVLLLGAFVMAPAARASDVAEKILADRDFFSEKEVLALQKEVERSQLALVKAAAREERPDGGTTLLMSPSALDAVSACRKLKARDARTPTAIREKFGEPDRVVRREIVWLEAPIEVTAYHYGDLMLGVIEGHSTVEIVRLRAGKPYPEVVDLLESKRYTIAPMMSR